MLFKNILHLSKTILILLIIIFIFSLTTTAQLDPVVKVGNITRIAGVRENQLIGYGIVIGLAGTGDSNRSQATIQSVANMLNNFGVEITSDQVQSQNLAAVIVTADLPPFVSNGDRIDVTISSIGDADSLQGGTLLMTPLKAANGDVYAVAQGPLSIGGFNISSGGNQVRENHPTVGRIPSGALVERTVDIELNREELTYVLTNPNFETSKRIADKINQEFSFLQPEERLAVPLDAGRVSIKVAPGYANDIVEYISRINNLDVQTALAAKVIINERTGTIVMGHNVRISTVSVAHANITITITTDTIVDQPPPLSEGETVVTEETNIQVDKEEASLTVLEGQNTIQDLVNALNTIGATPRDIIAIIQDIKAAGALHAEIELI